MSDIRDMGSACQAAWKGPSVGGIAGMTNLRDRARDEWHHSLPKH